MKTILIVEDEYGIAETLRDALTDDGYTVYVASNGHAALTLLESIVPDLVISDLMMPKMDGHTFTQQLRAMPQFNGTPLILMSAGHPALQVSAGHYNAFIAKPFNLYEVLATVAQLLGL